MGTEPVTKQRLHLHVRVVVKRPFSEHFVSGQRKDNKSGTLDPPITAAEGVFRGKGGFQAVSSRRTRTRGQVPGTVPSITINIAQIWESWARTVILVQFGKFTQSQVSLRCSKTYLFRLMIDLLPLYDRPVLCQPPLIANYTLRGGLMDTSSRLGGLDRSLV